jgi:F0F1-type ATP synthase membrane subunit b/b'
MLTFEDFFILGALFLAQLFCEFVIIAWVFNRVVSSQVDSIIEKASAQIKLDLRGPMAQLLQDPQFQGAVAQIAEDMLQGAKAVASETIDEAVAKYMPGGGGAPQSGVSGVGNGIVGAVLGKVFGGGL